MSSQSIAGVSWFLKTSPLSRSASIITQRQSVSFKEPSSATFIANRKRTTEVAGQKQLQVMEEVARESTFAGKKGTNKGAFVPVREVSIGDLSPRTSAGVLQSFAQARPVQAESAVITPTKVTGTPIVKTEPIASVVTPPIGVLSSANVSAPVQRIGQSAGDRIVEASLSPLQDWKKLIPVALLLALFVFGKGK
jgi:hypothetical protein